MSEKRFRVIDDNFSRWVEDTTYKEDKHEGTLYDVYDMCKKLNELVDENEELKYKLDFQLSLAETKIKNREKENENNKKDYRELYSDYVKLEEENEQLRKKLECCEYEHFLNELDEIHEKVDKDDLSDFNPLKEDKPLNDYNPLKEKDKHIGWKAL